MEKVEIIAEIELKPEYRDSFMPVLRDLVQGSRSEPGNKRYDLSENRDRPGHFFVVEEWLSEKALEEHSASPHFQNFVAQIQGKTEKINIVKVKNVFE